MKSAKTIIKRILEKGFKIRISRTNSKVSSIPEHRWNLLYEVDDFFNNAYDNGIEITGTNIDNNQRFLSKRRIRFYNTIQFFLQTTDLQGEIVECGCFKGLSSYIMCNYLKRLDKNFKGSGYNIIDSFEGLGQPTAEDSLGKNENGENEYCLPAGYFASPMENVKAALKYFPEIKYYKGWIPSVLNELHEQKYKFVHVDVDLYDPIVASLEYFYPRMVSGGIIIMDDYGSLFWPGAKKAVDEFCTKWNIKHLNITSAQAIIWKK